MKKAYPVILSRGEKFIVAYVPDFEINTQGTDIADAIEMARDAIGGEKNCTIPSWLNFEVKKAGVIYSK